MVIFVFYLLNSFPSFSHFYTHFYNALNHIFSTPYSLLCSSVTEYIIYYLFITFYFPIDTLIL